MITRRASAGPHTPVTIDDNRARGFVALIKSMNQHAADLDRDATRARDRRDACIAELRAGGYSYREISALTGLSTSVVQYADDARAGRRKSRRRPSGTAQHGDRT